MVTHLFVFDSNIPRTVLVSGARLGARQDLRRENS